MDFGKSVLGIIAQLGNEVMELKAENKELKAELSQLKADIKHDTKVCEDYDDGLIAECNDLKAEVESLQDQLKDAVNDYEKLLDWDGVNIE